MKHLVFCQGKEYYFFNHEYKMKFGNGYLPSIQNQCIYPEWNRIRAQQLKSHKMSSKTKFIKRGL